MNQIFRYLKSLGRKLDPPQAISALASVIPPDLATLRADTALEADVLAAIEGLTETAMDAGGSKLLEVRSIFLAKLHWGSPFVQEEIYTRSIHMGYRSLLKSFPQLSGSKLVKSVL